MDIKVWTKFAKKHKGILELWIDQSTDSLLKSINSEGVCFAMTFDFVSAFQFGGIGKTDFLNGIRNTSLTKPTSNRIPEKYIDMQEVLTDIAFQFKSMVSMLALELMIAKLDEDRGKAKELEKKLDDLIAGQRKMRFGSGLTDFTKFEVDNAKAPDLIYTKMIEMFNTQGPSYFIINMANDKKGHSVAFGIRPDLNLGKKFPKVFQIFDPNLGLFYFNAIENLEAFFKKTVWENLYSKTTYYKFEIASFTAKEY